MSAEKPVKVTDLLIRQKTEAMIEYGYIALRTLQKQYAASQVSLERISQSVTSWVAHASHANALGLRTKLLGKFEFTKTGGKTL